LALSDRELAIRLREAGDVRAEQFAMSALADRYIGIYRASIAASIAG
jgi:hypothetical protein